MEEVANEDIDILGAVKQILAVVNRVEVQTTEHSGILRQMSMLNGKLETIATNIGTLADSIERLGKPIIKVLLSCFVGLVVSVVLIMIVAIVAITNTKFSAETPQGSVQIGSR